MSKWIFFNKNLSTTLNNTTYYCCCRYFSNNSTELPNTCLYSLLKIKPDATQKQIKSAYYKLSLIFHPDKQGIDNKKASEKFSEISEAYNILSNANTRRVYDRSRKIFNQKSNTKNNFHEDDIKKYQINPNRQYDTWTRTHYLNQIELRNDRIKRDKLRDEYSVEEKEGKKGRIMIFGFAMLFLLPYAFVTRKNRRN